MTTTTLYCTLHRSNDTVYSVFFILHFSQLPHSTQLSLTHVRYLAELCETLHWPLLISVGTNIWNICDVLRNQEFYWLRRPTQVHSDSWAEYVLSRNKYQKIIITNSNLIKLWHKTGRLRDSHRRKVKQILQFRISNCDPSHFTQYGMYHLSNLSYNSFVEEVDNIKTSLHLFKT